MIPLGGHAHVRPESRGKHRNNRQDRGTHPMRTLSKTPEASHERHEGRHAETREQQAERQIMRMEDVPTCLSPRESDAGKPTYPGAQGGPASPSHGAVPVRIE